MPFVGALSHAIGNSWWGTEFHFRVDLMQSSSSKAAIWTYMAAPPKEFGKANFRFPEIAEGKDIRILVTNVE